MMMMMRMLSLCCLIISLITTSSHAQLTITATTPDPSSSDPNTPNTFIGTVGDQIASSLLDTSIPAMLWGIVSSNDVNAACNIIDQTGTQAITATVSDWGDSEGLILQIEDTAGCLAAEDASGTEFVFTDSYGRRSAVVCPSSNAGSTGCGVYITGDDINDLYNSYNGNTKNAHGSKRKLLSHATLLRPARPGGRSLLDCQSGAQKGAIGGVISGVLGTGSCLDLGPLAPFCVAGVLGVSAEVGSASGCVANCFPADAIVQTHGSFKRMSQLQIGDQIAVWGDDNRVVYQDIYAFGHKDPNRNATFLHFTIQPLLPTLSPARAIHLRLTHMHFIPTAPPTSIPTTALLASRSHVLYKRAQDVELGDIVWAVVNHDDQAVAPCAVKDISFTRSQGLYNPFTMGGTLIVDGVVASAHSEWFLDPIFDAMGLTNHLPYAYQLLLAPIRFLYYTAGKQAYSYLYHLLDSSLDVAAFGTYYGAHITISTMCGMLASLLTTCLMIRSKLHLK